MNENCGERELRIRELFPLVKRIARRVARMVPGSDIDDLVGEGCIGLIRAVDTFDAARGPTLERYASQIVAGAMLNGLRRLDPVSERVRREIRQAERERFALASREGHLPSMPEMERRRPALRRANLHAYRYAPLSLDGPLPLNEKFALDFTADPAAIAADRAERHNVRAALGALPPRQRDVLDMHYLRGISLHQIGKALSISPQRASQLHLAGLRKLRKVLHAAH